VCVVCNFPWPAFTDTEGVAWDCLGSPSSGHRAAWELAISVSQIVPPLQVSFARGDGPFPEWTHCTEQSLRLAWPSVRVRLIGHIVCHLPGYRWPLSSSEEL
jgi:hypothetical protein